MKKVRLFLLSQSVVFIILFTLLSENKRKEVVNVSSTKVNLLKADINRNLGRYEEAIYDYSRAIDLNPNNYFAYIDRGSAYRNLKQYQNAIEDFSQAIELDFRNSGLGYANRAYTYELDRNYRKALSDYDMAIRLKPDTISFKRQRGYLYSFKLKQHAKAISDYNTIIELEPQNTEVYLARGNAFHALNNYSKATLDYEKSLEQDAFLNYVSLNNLGLIQYELNNPQQAIKYWRKALEIVPDLEESKLAIAVSMYQQGNEDDAIRQAEQVGSIPFWQID